MRQGRHALAGHSQMLASLSYQSVLRRGFALVRDEAGRAVRSAAAVTPATRLEIELADGRIDVRVASPGTAGSSGSAGGGDHKPPAVPPVSRPARQRSPSGNQGSLF